MRKVFKYKIPCQDNFELELPAGIKFLSFQSQYEDMCIWALVDTNETRKFRYQFRLAGTGHDIDDEIAENGQYIGTCQIMTGALVFHLFFAGIK